MTKTGLHRLLGGALVLLSLASLVLLHIASTPPGINGETAVKLFNAGKNQEVQALFASAERHKLLLPYWKLGLWGTLSLMALVSAFNFRQAIFNTEHQNSV